jgi:glycosyltransferase involved in cell wall biosynthesis
MKFTIVIPTFKRADLLRIALQSISLQTAKHLINRVIVSENGLDKASEKVCDEFAGLPIQYVYQQEQLPVKKHMQWIMSQEQHDYVALLCDDDWWDIHHLAMAAEALDENKTCVAYFSDFAYVEAPNLLAKQKYHNGIGILHLKSPKFTNYKPTVFTKENIFLFSLLITPFHFSAMICKGDVLTKSVAIFDELHPTYVDRLLYPVISVFGDIIFNPLKTSIVLHHSSMDSHSYNSNEWDSQRQIGSLKVMQMAADNKIDLKSILNNAYTESSNNDKNFIIGELGVTFPDRSNIDWFVDVNTILLNDADKVEANRRENTFKRKVVSGVASAIRRVL